MALTALLLCVGPTLAQEALVLVGGRYADGYVDNEVEVWSHSADCGVNIKNTPDSFIDRPGVAFLENNLYVCGGHRIGTNSSSDDCDVYSLTDNIWTKGPPQPFNRTTNDGFEDTFSIRMATVGHTVVAAYAGNMQWPDFEPVEYQISTLGETGWSEPTSLSVRLDNMFLGMVALDEKHVALRDLQTYSSNETVYIVNVETELVVAKIIKDWECNSEPVLYNNQYTCIKRSADRKEVMSLSFSQDFSDPTWTMVETLPSDIFPIDYSEDFLTVVDGMLTVVFSRQAAIFYLDGGEWKSEEMDIPRTQSGHVVIPCLM